MHNWLRDEAHLIGKAGIGTDHALPPRELHKAALDPPGLGCQNTTTSCFSVLLCNDL